jgi:hypothetical protein
MSLRTVPLQHPYGLVLRGLLLRSLLLCGLSLLLPVTAGAAGSAALRVAAPGADCRAEPRKYIYCSLREAVAAANAAAGEQLIVLDKDASYDLTEVDHQNEGGNGLPAITGKLRIDGNGATIRRSDAAGTPVFRLLRIDKGGELTLDRLTLRNGSTTRGFDGAAIWNVGRLTLTNCTLESNHSGDDGGAIRSDGILNVADSLIRGNSARWRGGVGGGVQTSTQFGSAETLLERTRLENNEAWAGGGALWLMGTTRLVDTRLTGNRAGDRGGGILNYGALEMRGATVTDNQAGVTAGGLFTYGPATLSKTQLSGNRAMIATDCQGTVTSLEHNDIGNSFRCTQQPGAAGAPAGAAPVATEPSAAGSGAALRPEGA